MMFARSFTLLAGLAVAASASAQIPDLLNAFDAGSTSFGAGGAFQASSADTLSAFFNPAGLGYLYRPQVGAAYRNLPQSTSAVQGTLGNLQRVSRVDGGPQRLTHFGYALPFRDVFRRGAGTLALTYQIGGTVNDFSFANNTVVNLGGGLGIAGFQERRRALSEFYTVAYGRTTAAQNLSFGFGVQMVQQRLELVQTGTVVDGQGNPQSGAISPLVERRGTATGFGLIAGVQYQPSGLPGMSFSLSVRTPISLSGGDAGSLYDRIPGRILAGAALRTQGLRRGRDDFGVFGVQFAQFFSSGGGALFDTGNQSGAAIGYEYVLVNGTSRIPIRLGYTAMGASGVGFERHRGLTYGIGFRPNDRISLDVNFMRPDRGPQETVFTASYRF